MSNKLTYIKSLDGFRAFLAFFIVVTHWPLDLPISPIGWESMQGFFVLSGFLITRILLDDRDKSLHQSEGNFGGFWKGFMLKRVYRIFPVYFGYLILMYLVRYSMADSKFLYSQTAELEINGIWLWTYLYNFKDIFNHLLGWQMAESKFFTHLWSLALEEQFYIFFPFIVYFVRGRALKITIVAMIIIPFFTRIIGYPYLQAIAEANNYSPQWAILNIYRNFFFQFDSLALGAAAAIFNIHHIKNPRIWFFAILSLLIGAYIYNGYLIMQFEGVNTAIIPSFLTNGNKVNLLGLMYVMGHPELLGQYYQYIYMFNLVNWVTFFIIVCAATNQPILRRVFENDAIVYLGKISYGTYVYHLAIMQVFFFMVKKILFLPPPGYFLWLQFIYFIVIMCIVYCVSHLSYKYYELYFLKLKSKIK
jgi:peptidoglycan/LPS O-acetylase OafA/YrhL